MPRPTAVPHACLMTFQRSFSRGAVATLLAAVACMVGPVADADAQQVTIDTGPNGPTNDDTPTFSFSTVEPMPTFQCRIYPGGQPPQPGTFGPCTGTNEREHTADPPLNDGDWVFEVQLSSVSPPVGDSRAFTVDTIGPVTTLASVPPGLSNDATPEFSFTASEAGAFECWLHAVGDTSAAFAPCSSPHAPGALGDGAYVFEVKTVDLLRNPGSPVAHSFEIDTTPPQTTITGGPGDTTAATAVFLFSAPGAARFSCRLDGGAWQPCRSPHTYPTLGLGPHGFEVTAVDAAGNQDPTPAQHAWQVLRPGRVIPGAVEQATALAKELVQMRRALARIRLRTLARRQTVTLRTFDAVTAGIVRVRARTRVRRGRSRRWIVVLSGRREVPDAGRHRVRARVTKNGRRLARTRRGLRLELRLGFTDLAGRSLSATAKLTLRSTRHRGGGSGARQVVPAR